MNEKISAWHGQFCAKNRVQKTLGSDGERTLIGGYILKWKCCVYLFIHSEDAIMLPHPTSTTHVCRGLIPLCKGPFLCQFKLIPSQYFRYLFLFLAFILSHHSGAPLKQWGAAREATKGGRTWEYDSCSEP